MKTAFLFPGQGSHKPEMLKELPDHPIIHSTIKEANAELNESGIFLDSTEALQSTRNVQLALLIAGVASARALQADGTLPDMVAGHSVGAFGAAVIADVLDFPDALKIVKKRGELMEQAYPHGYGMGVIIGLREKQLRKLTESAPVSQPVYIANLNSPDQITISGSTAGIEWALETARKTGARKAEFLNVSTPSHCPLMESVSQQLARELEPIPFRSPTIPFAGNRNGRALRRPEDIKHDLTANVSHSVRWHDATSLFYELGARLFIELHPGHILTDLICTAFPSSRPVSVADSGLRAPTVLYHRMKMNR